MTKKDYYALKIRVFRWQREDVVTASFVELGVRWDSEEWTDGLTGDFE